VCGSAPEWLVATIDDGAVPWKKRKAKKVAVSQADRPTQSAGGPVSRPPVGQSTSRAAGVSASHPAPPLGKGNSELREYLRLWRRDVARNRGLPAFAVMHDTSLEELCRFMPDSLAALRQIHGFGERKTEMFGREIIAVISRFRQAARALDIPKSRRGTVL
jgi:superfamily II DNA helicase RecQ